MSIVGTSRGLSAHGQVLLLVSRRESHVLLLRGEKWVPPIAFDALPLGQPQAMLLGAGVGNGGPVPDGVGGCTPGLSPLIFKACWKGSVFLQSC